MSQASIPGGAVTVNAGNREEYLRIVAEYESEGYTFVPCDDYKRLHYGAIGTASATDPVVWVRMPILRIVPAAEEEGEDAAAGGAIVFSEGTTHLGDTIEEVTTDVFRYHRAFKHHKDRGHHLIEASDPFTYRLAFVCVTCARVVRIDHDQCIDLACLLERSVRESTPSDDSGLE